LLVVVAVGVYAWKRSGPDGMYFASFLFISTVAFLMVDVDTKKRLIYNYSFGLLAAMGLMRLQQTKNEAWRRILPIFIVLVMLAYQLRSLANLV
jgi:hypothetical protein